MGHLEDPRLIADLTVARDFDLGMTGPPLNVALDFIAGGLVELVRRRRVAAVLFVFLVGAAGARRCVDGDALPAARERGLVRSQHRRGPGRAARCRLRVHPRRQSAGEQGAASLGLAGWVIERFVSRRTRLHELQYHATRLRERPVLGAC